MIPFLFAFGNFGELGTVIMAMQICIYSKLWQADKLETFDITKTCLYKFDPLKSHLYIVKLGFPGVYIIFLISAQT